MTHVPQALRESAEFAHARIDALQASMAAALGKNDATLEGRLLQALQDMDMQLVAKWGDIAPAIRERES